MVLKLQNKEAIVAEVAEKAKMALSAVAVDYRGLKVSEMTLLRAKAREAGVYLRVVRNTLARRALNDTDFACLSPELKGPLILAFSLDDPGAAGRLLSDALDKFENLSVKAIALGGQLLAPEKIKDLAKMPTYNQAIAILMSTLKAPISRLGYALSWPSNQLVRTFSALGQRKQ